MTGDSATFDEELIKDGLWLSLIGMGVVFAVLSLLAVVINVFDRVDSLIPADGKAGAMEGASPQTTPEAPSPQQAADVPAPGDAETAAAIALALALAGSQTGRGPTSSVPGTASPVTNSWLTAGRSREMSRRTSGLSGRNQSSR